MSQAGTPLSPADEDALLSDLAEADRHVRQALFGDTGRRGAVGDRRVQLDRAYVAALLRHALEIVEGNEA